MTNPDSDLLRLNRFLARAGCGSRRGVEAAVLAGRVTVDGEVVREPGRRVDPFHSRVTLDGAPIVLPERWRVYAFHKPTGVVSSLRPQGETPCLAGYRDEAGLPFSFVPVGRLDAPTSGLLLWTDDGALAQHLLLPRRHVWKRYRLRLNAPLTPDRRTMLADGVLDLDGRPCLPARLEDMEDRGLRWRFHLREGRNRQIRRMFEAVGLRVLELHREAFGPVELGDLAPGAFRELEADEVAELRDDVREES